jgi:hypothetical protein
MWGSFAAGLVRRNLGRAIVQVNERLEPPRNATSTIVSLHDSFDGMVHCPFCGKLSAKYINEEFIPNVCEHMLVFSADNYHQYISGVLLTALMDCKFPLSSIDHTCSLGDRIAATWPIADLAGIVGYSIIFSQGLGSLGSEIGVTVAYYPGGADDRVPSFP